MSVFCNLKKKWNSDPFALMGFTPYVFAFVTSMHEIWMTRIFDVM